MHQVCQAGSIISTPFLIYSSHLQNYKEQLSQIEVLETKTKQADEVYYLHKSEDLG